MADDEQPAPEQAGGPAPPPGLGVPRLGGQGETAGQTGAPGTGRPEIVAPSSYGAPAPKPRRRALTVTRIIVVALVVLAGLGWAVTLVRHAHATPADKQACASTLTALQTISPATLQAMLHDVDFADDKTLLAAAGDMTLHIQQQNIQGLDTDLNKVIHRCNQLSDQFKTGFQSFCDSHPGYCRETFHIGPF